MHISSYLSEGLTIFKDSARLHKIADKIAKKSSHSSSEITIIVSKLRSIADVFAKLEEDYQKAETPEIKQEIRKNYEEARTKYTNFINLINKESFVSALTNSINLGIIGAAIILGYKNIDIYTKKEVVHNATPNIKAEKETQSIVGAALMGVTAATAIGFAKAFKNIFANKGDELFEKSKNALITLERVEQMQRVKTLPEPEEKA